MAMRRECKKNPNTGITSVDLYDGERRIFGISIAEKFIPKLPPEQIDEEFWKGCLDIVSREGENPSFLIYMEKVYLVTFSGKDSSGTTLMFKDDRDDSNDNCTPPIHCHYHGDTVPENIAALQRLCGTGIAKSMRLNREC